jgi:WD40 repeat protein
MLRNSSKPAILGILIFLLGLLTSCGDINTPAPNPQAAIATPSQTISSNTGQTPTPIPNIVGYKPTGISQVSWSPDGKILAGVKGSKALLWDKQGHLITTLIGHKGAISSLAWSPNSQFIATGSAGKGADPKTAEDTVRVWKTDGTTILTLTGHSDQVESLAWSPDGTLLASGSYDETIRLWNVANGALISILRGHTLPIFTLAWSPDGKILASGCEDATIRLWSNEGKFLTVLNGHSQGVYALAWSPDGKTLASGSMDGTGRLWNTDGKSLAVLSGHTSPIFYTLAWSPNGKLLALGSTDGTVQLWDPNGKLIITFKAQIDSTSTDLNFRSVNLLGWSPDSTKLALTTSKVQIWDVASQTIQTIQDHLTPIYSLAWSSQGILAVGYGDGTAQLWDSEGKPLAIIPA